MDEKNFDDSVIEALITIQKYCKKYEECEGCRMTDEDGNCGIREKIPMDWKINKDREIKYLL